MQGGWAWRQGQDLRAGGGGIGCSISATHSVVDKHTNNCANAGASAPTPLKMPAPVAPSLNKMMVASTAPGAKAGAATTIAKARRRPCGPLPRGGRPACLAIAMGRTARKDAGDGNGDNDKDKKERLAPR